MSAETAPRGFSADQLCAAARSKGFAVSRRLITDWVSLGLLDKANDTGRGRARGKSYTWPQTQRDLFLTLLVHHQRKPAVSRATLTNIPVSLWLIWGDDYVPLRQVRRALGTWAGRHGRASWSQAQHTAAQVLDQLDHPDATPEDREQLVDTISQAAYRGTIDVEALARLARNVFDPHETNLTRGPLGIMKSDDYVQTVVGRTAALAQLDSADDADYYAAREVYRQLGPASPQRALKLDGRSIAASALGTGKPLLLDEIVNRACLDLITLLGLTLTKDQR